MSQAETAPQLSAQQVAEYLSDNTEFFVEYPELTAELIIPHQQRGSVSLVELQAEQLRSQLHQQRQHRIIRRKAQKFT